MNISVTSEGICAICKKTYKKRGIKRHLKSHLKKMEEEKKEINKSFLIKIEADPIYGTSGYFLYIWVDENTTLQYIDDFLRNIWLECCGHMSAFKEKKSSFDSMFRLPKISKGKAVKKVFYEGQKIEYTYDFGSSTFLIISIEGVYNVKAPDQITLLSRNEPLEILCETCGKKPAEYTCPIHYYDEDSLFCKKCAQKHAKTCTDFEYAALPIVNSPRFGICAYSGGVIDVERDGVYKIRTKKEK